MSANVFKTTRERENSFKWERKQFAAAVQNHGSLSDKLRAVGVEGFSNML